MKNRSKKYIEWIACGLGAMALFFFYFRVLPYHLFHREQTQLFLYSSETFLQYWHCPAALACLTGDYLTQFFYYTGTGPAILTLVLVLWGIIVYRLLALYIGRWAYIPAVVAVIWEAGQQSGIVYPLSATLALVGGGALALLCRKWMAASWKTALPLGILVTALSYYLFGCGIWLTVLFLFNRRNLWVWVLLIIEAVFLPALTRQSLLLTPIQAYTYPATSWYNIPNMEQEKLLSIDSEIYFGRQAKAWKILSETDLHKPLLTYYYNLLNARQAQLPLMLMEYYQPAAQGLFLSVGETSTYLQIYAANEVWFELGDMTMAEHAAILGMIFSPHHTGTRAIKRLAEINLVNNDDTAAMKYLRLLQKTHCHKKWAEQRIPGKQTQRVVQWLETKRQMLSITDTLRLSADVTLSLKNLLQANPANRVALDYLLCYHLLHKNIPAFVQDYTAYAIDTTPCRLYAEALLIYLAGNAMTAESVKTWKIIPQVLNEFVEYTRIYKDNDGYGAPLQDKYGKTYWFYFHYATMKQ